MLTNKQIAKTATTSSISQNVIKNKILKKKVFERPFLHTIPQRNIQ